MKPDIKYNFDLTADELQQLRGKLDECVRLWDSAGTDRKKVYRAMDPVSAVYDGLLKRVEKQMGDSIDDSVSGVVLPHDPDGRITVDGYTMVKGRPYHTIFRIDGGVSAELYQVEKNMWETAKLRQESDEAGRLGMNFNDLKMLNQAIMKLEQRKKELRKED